MTHIFDELSKFFSMELSELAKKIGYSEENILILKLNETELKIKYPETYNNIKSCVHNKDNRTSMEYARDLVSSWLFEDYMITKFSKLGYKLLLVGNDKNRNILPNAKVGADSDAIFIYEENNIKVEIVNDYTGYWSKHKKLHLRDSKYKKLLAENSILLAISIKDKSFALIPITNATTYNYINSHHPYGGKPAYEVLINEEFKPFLVENIITELLKYIKNRNK